MVKELAIQGLVPQGGSQKSRIQKSKELYSKLLRHLKWYVYLRHAVLVPYLPPYSCRHTFATWAITSGITADKVALWIGDTVQTVLQHYCHPEVVNAECPDF